MRHSEGSPVDRGPGRSSAVEVLLAEPTRTSPARTVARFLLGGALAGAGLGHLTSARQEFQAQVPDWVPMDPDLVVLLSGGVELALGGALVLAGRHRVPVGWVVAGFFVAVFPGNISQFVDGDDGFGLDSDLARGVRLLFQPALVAWALWSTAAWATWRDHTTGSADGATTHDA